MELTTGIAGLPINMLGLVGDLIAAFIREAANLIADALELMQGYREAMAKMRGTVAALADLVPMGHMVGDPASRQPRPAPAG